MEVHMNQDDRKVMLLIGGDNVSATTRGRRRSRGSTPTRRGPHPPRVLHGQKRR